MARVGVAEREEAGLRRRRSVRLAAVMNGGPSCALYGHGVVTELCHAGQSRGVYGLIGLVTGSDFVVETSAGSSFGALNAIFLACAVANGRDLAATSPLWWQGGDIGQLVRWLEQRNRPRLSFVHATEYEKRIEDALRGMAAAADGDRRSAPRDIDLRVALPGDAAASGLDSGTKSGNEITDGAVGYHVTHRLGGHEELSVGAEGTCAALARLGRLAGATCGSFAALPGRDADAGSSREQVIEGRLSRWRANGRGECGPRRPLSPMPADDTADHERIPVCVLASTFRPDHEGVAPPPVKSRFESSDRAQPAGPARPAASAAAAAALRVNPRAAQSVLRRYPLAVSHPGDDLRHLTRFVAGEGDCNDLFLGRLDAACLLVDRLLTPSRLRAVLSNPVLRLSVAEELARHLAPGLSSVFSRSGPSAADRIEAWLADLFLDGDARRARALSDHAFRTHVGAIIEATQLEIAGGELVHVLRERS